MKQLLMDPATQIFFLVPLGLILLDALLGILWALKRKRFDVSWLGLFASSNVVPYASLLLTFLVVPLASGVPYLLAAGAAKAAFGVYCVSQLESVLNNLTGLLGKPSITPMINDAINGVMAKIFPWVPALPVTPATPADSAPSEPAA